MSKFSEAVLREQDATRVRAVRTREAGRIDRQFAPIKRKAQANMETVLRPVKQGEMRIATS
jgi:hypothetical protein